MDEEIYRKILDEGNMQLEHDFSAYISDLRERTSDSNNFITISELEMKNYNINAKLQKIVSNATSDLLSSINDGDLLNLKKRIQRKNNSIATA